MTFETIHLGDLHSRHAMLEAELADELKRPAPDAVKVAKIKREKLRIKETIAGLRPMAAA
jgi:hypothetical protein